MTPLFNAGSYVNPVFGSSQPLIINCISLCHTQPLISLFITFYHSLALDRVTTRASALPKTKQGKTRGTYKLRGLINLYVSRVPRIHRLEDVDLFPCII